MSSYLAFSSSDLEQPDGEPFGIPCGTNMCKHCCIEKFMTCGAEIDCDDSFSMTMLVVVASVMVMFFTILSYLLFVHHFGSTKYFDRMAQVVLNKQYKKMVEEKKIGITMAKTVHENAPIKYAEVIEGMSDVEVEEETPRMESVSRLLGDSGAIAQ